MTIACDIQKPSPGPAASPRKATVKAKLPRLEIGWAELVDLPDLGFADVPAKIDSGARTSSLHATHIRVNGTGDDRRVSFRVRKGRGDRVRSFDLPLFEHRRVRSSNGVHQERPVIRTAVLLGGITQLVEITLTNRGSMAFPMLVGRSTLKRHYLVNCRRKYTTRAPFDPLTMADRGL